VSRARGLSAAALLAAIALLVACGAGSGASDPLPTGVASGVCPKAGADFGGGKHPPACWRPYARTSPFNRRVPANPKLAPDSARVIRTLTGWGKPQALLAGHADTDSDYFHPIYWSKRTDPIFEVRCLEYGGCPLEGRRVRIPDVARPAGGDDGHMAVIDPRRGVEYDFWQVRDKPAGGGVLRVSYGGSTKIGGNGLGSQATAAWFGLAAGMLRAAEVEAGSVEHALFIAIKCSSGRSVYPAHAGTSAAPCSRFGLDHPDAPPLGARIWLDLTPAQIKKLDVPHWRKTILLAMHRYGMIVGDTNGGNAAWGLIAESGSGFTSYGQKDPWAVFASRVVDQDSRPYALPITGVDWARHLKVLDPCVSRGRC
jgi:hypothetical protein